MAELTPNNADQEPIQVNQADIDKEIEALLTDNSEQSTKTAKPKEDD